MRPGTRRIKTGPTLGGCLARAGNMVHWETEGFLSAKGGDCGAWDGDVVYMAVEATRSPPNQSHWMKWIAVFLAGAGGVVAISFSISLMVSSSEGDPLVLMGLWLLGLVLIMLSLFYGLGAQACCMLCLRMRPS